MGAVKAAETKSSARKTGPKTSAKVAVKSVEKSMEMPQVAKAKSNTKPNAKSAATAARVAPRLPTEAEVISSGEAEYMNEAQRAFFRNRLQTMERDILRNAGETTEHLRETTVVPDPADRATIEEEHAIELRTRDRERKLLKKIQQSIVRIDSGDYGYCEETGEPIGVLRLLARPTATLALEAQERREMKQRLYGVESDLRA
jgi:DnaK suppressor protein